MVIRFDFADIEKVNRIELKPGEIVLFRSREPLDVFEEQKFYRTFRHTSLEGRVRLFTGDWSIAIVNPGEEE